MKNKTILFIISILIVSIGNIMIGKGDELVSLLGLILNSGLVGVLCGLITSD